MISRALGVAAFALASSTAEGQGGVTVFGVVYDSLRMRVLAGADVQLVDATDRSRGWTVHADSNGGYRFERVAAGRYLLGFVHDAVDSLGIDAPQVAITVRSDAPVERTLAIPGARALVRRLCQADVARDSTGLFVGHVRRAADGRFQPNGRVVVRWTELRFTPRGIDRATPTSTAETDERGMFAMCGIPIATPVVVRAWAGPDSSGLVELDLPENGLLVRDLLVGRAVTSVAVQTFDEIERLDGLPWRMRRDTIGVTRIARGAGVVSGRVTVMTGSPLGAVRIGVWGTGLVTETDANGAFRLDSVPDGSQTLVARSIGFAPYRAVIDVRPNIALRHDVTLAPFVAALDTVRVLGARPGLDSWRSGFDVRRRRGMGDFLDETQIARLSPLSVSDLMRDMAGVDVLPFGAFGRRVVMRSRAGGLYCVPAVFVDGIKFFTGGSRPGVGTSSDLMEYTGTADLEYVVNPLDIKAMEVYVHDSAVPPEFDVRDGCGSIVIWTGARRRQPPMPSEKR